MAGHDSIRSSLGLRGSLWRLLAALMLTGPAVLGIPGCGFHLRGPGEPLHFSRLRIEGNLNAPMTAALKRKLEHYPGLTLTDKADDADVRLQISSEQRERVILSLTTAGRVREVTLRQRVKYQMVNAQGDLLAKPDTLISERVLSTNDTDTLAKESEEKQIYQQLQDDAIRLLTLRLQALRLPQAAGVIPTDVTVVPVDAPGVATAPAGPR